MLMFYLNLCGNSSCARLSRQSRRLERPDRKRKPEAPPPAQAAQALLSTNAPFDTTALEDLLPQEGFEIVQPPAEECRKEAR